MKKYRAILALVLVLASLMTMVPAVSAADGPVLTVSGATISASKGDTVTYEIRASQSGRIYPASVCVTWAYDTSVFTLEKAEIGNLCFDMLEPFSPTKINTETNTYTGFIYSEANEGVLLTLTFKIAKDCDAKTYPVIVTAEYFEDTLITGSPFFPLYKEISSKYNCYSVSAESGAITVNDHVYGAWQKHSDTEHKRECTLCHDIVYEEHNFDAGVVEKMASCISEGTIVYTCKDCSFKRTETIPKSDDHVYGAWVQHNDTQHKRSCECGATEYADHVLGGLKKHDAENHKRVCECGYAVYSAHSFGAWQKHDEENHKRACECGEWNYAAHTWDAGKVTKPAQHLEEGIRTHTCTVCAETKNEPIPKTSTHNNYGAWQKHDADQHKRVCACGTWDYADHEWDAGEVTTPATSTQDGVYTYTCKVCGDTKTDVIPRFSGSEGLAFYDNKDGTFSVRGIGTCTDKDIVIPTATPNGEPVVGIRNNAFKDNKDITSVTIPVGIKTIGNYAFKGCSALRNVTFSGGLAEIGKEAFSGCSSLESVAIPSGITLIPEKLFFNCKKLSSVTLPGGLTEIGTAAFSGCAALTSLNIPMSVTAIGNNAFMSCLALKTITIPKNVQMIGNYAFSGCAALENVKLNEGLQTIGDYAFQSCEKLKAIAIPGSVQTIGESAFYYCEDLKTLTFGEGVISIGSSAFSGCESLLSVVLPDSLESLGSSAFAYCTFLRDVTLPENLKTIGSSCFAYCKKLARLVLPDGATIGTYAWTETALTEVYYFGTPASFTALNIPLAEGAKVAYYAENKPEAADGNDYWHFEDGSIVLWVLYIRGDMNGDSIVNSADAIYLLRHTIMQAMYPVVQSADVNGDGTVNSADAIYLLRHSIMPSMYPLK